ncbi:hypothetical protein [Coleofasciculus sp. G2-EDA-02]|uniref:hypothetical protein n=1 Tax=Coleofasciculus sp. G2-EDA-02 TaxID=3069529 RepID=UPI0033048B26
MAQLNLLPPEFLQEIDSCPVKPQSDTGELLKLLAQMGMHQDLIAMLLKFAEIPIPLLRYYAGPLVLHRTPWSESIPDWLKTACLSDRLDLIVDEYNKGVVVASIQGISQTHERQVNRTSFRNILGKRSPGDS